MQFFASAKLLCVRTALSDHQHDCRASHQDAADGVEQLRAHAAGGRKGGTLVVGNGNRTDRLIITNGSVYTICLDKIQFMDASRIIFNFNLYRCCQLIIAIWCFGLFQIVRAFLQTKVFLDIFFLLV